MNHLVVDVAREVNAERLRQAQLTSVGRRLQADRRAPRRRRVLWQPWRRVAPCPATA